MGIIDTWKTQLRTTFTDGDPTIPQWQFEFEKGDDAGYFPVGSAVWTVHSSMTPTVAGIRALLLQTLHPGAMVALELIARHGIRLAVLKARSPSCGNVENYDGSFSGTRVAGEGVTAAALKRAGVAVFNETELQEAQRLLAALEGNA